MNVYIFGCVIVCTAMLDICAYIYIPTYINKFMGMHMQNCISCMLCNIILLGTVCSDIYKHTHTYIYSQIQECMYVCVYIVSFNVGN